jgi:hypothetical protein
LTRSLPSLTIVGALALVASGCGSGKDYAHNPRPASPIVVAASITSGGINISPSHFGAGLIQLVVTNLTGSSQQVTVKSTAGSGFQQQTAPINPQDTAEVKANLGQGGYLVSVADPNVKSANLAVGAPRKTSQDQLLQP